MIRLSDEVQQAQRDGIGVVALETTLVAHGFPPGEGVAVGLESEAAVRASGVRPRDDRCARRARSSSA